MTELVWLGTPVGVLKLHPTPRNRMPHGTSLIPHSVGRRDLYSCEYHGHVTQASVEARFGDIRRRTHLPYSGTPGLSLP